MRDFGAEEGGPFHGAGRIRDPLDPPLLGPCLVHQKGLRDRPTNDYSDKLMSLACGESKHIVSLNA